MKDCLVINSGLLERKDFQRPRKTNCDILLPTLDISHINTFNPEPYFEQTKALFFNVGQGLRSKSMITEF